MELLITGYFFGLIFGLGLLWVSGDLCVRYSVKTAHLFKITTLFVGFFLIALSTGLPELAVIAISAFKNVSSIAVGTIIGSLLADIGFALGITAFFVKSISITRKESKNMIVMLIISMIVMAFVFYIQVLNKFVGLFLVVFYFVLIWWIYRDQATLKEAKEKKAEVREVVNKQPLRRVFWTSKPGVLIKLFASIALMFFASEIVVRFIIKIGEHFSYSMSIIGVTVSGLATSLPELTLGVSAVRKKEFSLALGNIIGSVLEEATFLLGVAVLASPTVVSVKALNSLIPFLALTLGITTYALVKNSAFKRIHGILVFIIFVIFMVYHLFF